MRGLTRRITVKKSISGLKIENKCREVCFVTNVIYSKRLCHTFEMKSAHTSQTNVEDCGNRARGIVYILLLAIYLCESNYLCLNIHNLFNMANDGFDLMNFVFTKHSF